MITPKVGFIVYGVHKDGLLDPMGAPFIDNQLIANAKNALREAGLELVEHDVILATKGEARECFAKFKHMDDIDAVVLFSGTWVWAAHLIGAIRDFAFTGKGVVIWTVPGSQGWRPVGGLVLQGALKEVGIKHRFVYGGYDDPREVDRILSYCRASHMKNKLNMSTLGAFGGRGMGQTCGVADPSQWMKTFGVDIDSRDVTELIETAQAIPGYEVLLVRFRHRSTGVAEEEHVGVVGRSVVVVEASDDEHPLLEARERFEIDPVLLDELNEAHGNPLFLLWISVSQTPTSPDQ